MKCPNIVDIDKFSIKTMVWKDRKTALKYAMFNEETLKTLLDMFVSFFFNSIADLRSFWILKKTVYLENRAP